MTSPSRPTISVDPVSSYTWNATATRVNWDPAAVMPSPAHSRRNSRDSRSGVTSSAMPRSRPIRGGGLSQLEIHPDHVDSGQAVEHEAGRIPADRGEVVALDREQPVAAPLVEVEVAGVGGAGADQKARRAGGPPRPCARRRAWPSRAPCVGVTLRPRRSAARAPACHDRAPARRRWASRFPRRRTSSPRRSRTRAVTQSLRRVG